MTEDRTTGEKWEADQDEPKPHDVLPSGADDESTGEKWRADQDVVQGEREAEYESVYGAAAGDAPIADADADYLGTAPLDPSATDLNTDYDVEVDPELLDEPGRDIPEEEGPAASVEDFEPMELDPEEPDSLR